MNFSEAYNNYYAILNSSYRTKDMIIDDLPTSSDQALVTEMNALIDTFLNMVDILRNYERKKEKEYLQLWLKKLSKAKMQNGQSLSVLLEPLVLSDDPNFTQAFQMVELWRQGFITEVDSLQQIYDDWRQQYIQFANVTIMKSAREAVKSLGDNIANITPNQLVQNILDKILSDWEKKNGKSEDTNFLRFMNEFSPYLTKIIKEMKDIKDVWNTGLDLKTTFKIEKPKELNKTIMSKIVDGLVNGLSQEMMLVTFGSGASTARATRTLKFINGKEMEVATETDVYAVLNNDLTPNQKMVDKIKNFEKDSDIQQLIVSSELDNNFILHYSSKDLTIAESKGSSGAVAKIKGEGGLGSKIPALEDMGNAAGEPGAVHNLIFKAINVGKDLIYDNQAQLVNQISTSLTALTFSFMFDDFERQFEQIRGKVNQNNTEINLYAISGNYYPASDILTTLYNYVESLSKGNKMKSFINVGFKPSKKSAWDIYLEKKKTNYGDELWQEVRNTVAAEAKMQVRMSTNYLRNLTFAIQNRQQ